MSDAERSSLLRAVRWPLLVLILVLVSWVAYISLKTSGTPDSEQRERFYVQEIEPKLSAAGRSNQQAVDRTITRIDDAIAEYRNGIEPFTKDITSIGTRIGTLKRMSQDWWYGDESEEVKGYLKTKFEEHLFSEVQVTQDVSEALAAFREDIEANQNRLLSECRVAVVDGGLPDLVVPEYHDYEKVISEMFPPLNQDIAKRTVYEGIVAIVVAETIGILAEQIVIQIVASLTTSATTTATSSVVVGGGTTAAGATTGGTLGSPGGPPGIVIGAVAGIVIAIIIDWWMTENFQAKLAAELDKYFNDLRNNLVDGTAESPGLQSALQRVADELGNYQATALKKAMIGTEE